MKIPKRLRPLIEDGIIDDVLQQLMSGKEATVYTVRVGDQVRCAKVYKDAAQRSFKQAVQYQEGRKVRNSRRQRAIDKGSKYGRKQQEDNWHQAEVDALYALSRAGVRVPEPYGCFDGVLLMELITLDDGEIAPRLNDVSLSPEQAIKDHATMMAFIKFMLIAGIVHGDLSEFNVLMDDKGPVIIDLPQAVNAASNHHAEKMLYRDVQNMTDYYGQYAPELLNSRYGEEIWAHYEAGLLDDNTQLTGQFIADESEADVDAVLEEIKAIYAEEQAKQARLAAQRDD